MADITIGAKRAAFFPIAFLPSSRSPAAYTSIPSPHTGLTPNKGLGDKMEEKKRNSSSTRERKGSSGGEMMRERVSHRGRDGRRMGSSVCFVPLRRLAFLSLDPLIHVLKSVTTSKRPPLHPPCERKWPEKAFSPFLSVTAVTRTRTRDRK